MTSKEIQLLKAAATGSNNKAENILKGLTNPLKRWLSKDRLDDILEDDLDDERPSLPVVSHKQVSPHVEVNCTDEHGATPLIIASLNGHKDVVLTLLQFSADVHYRDKQGNTALHMAAWQNRTEIIELLLLNGAIASVGNKEGNSPLHYACQHSQQGKTLSIIKLLQYDASVLVSNNKGDTPIDLAIRYQRKEVVAVLVDEEKEIVSTPKYIVEAAKNGCKEIVEIFLEAGTDPNSFDSESGSLPLHEAIRYFRRDVAALLLEFGAQPGMRNSKQESVIDVINAHPERRREDFMKLLRDTRGRTPRTPKEKSARCQTPDEMDEAQYTCLVHPLLRNRPSWVRNTGDHYSAATKMHPVTAVIENDPCTYWLIPAPGSYHWVMFDLGSEFTLSGLRLYGWGNKKMVYSFIVETSSDKSGPWNKVGKYQADLVGPEDMALPPEGQDFKGFYDTSRYWRIVIADNYGDHVTAIAGIEFYGIETDLIDWFKALDMGHYVKRFVEKGFNQLSELAIMSEYEIEPLIRNAPERKRILSAARSLRPRYFPPSNLCWAIKPPKKVTEGKVVTEFSVRSDPYTVGDVILLAHSGGTAVECGRCKLNSRDDGYQSKGSFVNVIFPKAGKYLLELQSAIDASVVLKFDEVFEVAPPPKRNSEIARMFDGFDDMLNFD